MVLTPYVEKTLMCFLVYFSCSRNVLSRHILYNWIKRKFLEVCVTLREAGVGERKKRGKEYNTRPEGEGWGGYLTSSDLPVADFEN